MDEDDVQVQVLARRRQRASRDHPCHGCEAGIRQGEGYWIIVAIFDGEFSHLRYCQACYMLAG